MSTNMIKKTKNAFVTKKAFQQYMKTHVERKGTYVPTIATFAEAGIVTPVSTIAQGDGITNRAGNQVTCTRVDYRYVASNAAHYASARYIIVRDTLNLGATPAVTDILESASAESHYNFTNVLLNKRFVILSDEHFCIGLNHKNVHVGHKTIRCNFPIYFDGTTDADGAKNSVFLLVVGTDIANENSIPALSGNVRVFFTDA